MGFPRTVSHRAKFETSKNGGQANVAVTLDCRDGAGHVVKSHRNEIGQKANVVFEAEPMVIESFRRQLRRLAEERTGAAV